MKLLQIVPREGTRLYGAIIKKQAEIPPQRSRDVFSGQGKKAQGHEMDTRPL